MLAVTFRDSNGAAAASPDLQSREEADCMQKDDVEQALMDASMNSRLCAAWAEGAGWAGIDYYGVPIDIAACSRYQQALDEVVL